MPDISSYFEQEIQKLFKASKLSLNSLIYFDENYFHFQKCEMVTRNFQEVTLSELTENSNFNLGFCAVCFPEKSRNKASKNSNFIREGLQKVLFFKILQIICETKTMFLPENIRTVLTKNKRFFNTFAEVQQKELMEKISNHILSQTENVHEFNKLLAALEKLWAREVLVETPSYFSYFTKNVHEVSNLYGTIASYYLSGKVSELPEALTKIIQIHQPLENLTLKEAFEQNPELLKICSSYEEIIKRLHQKRVEGMKKVLVNFEQDFQKQLNDLTKEKQLTYLTTSNHRLDSARNYLKEWLVTPSPGYGYNKTNYSLLSFSLSPLKVYGNCRHITTLISLEEKSFTFTAGPLTPIPNDLTENEIETTVTLLNDKVLSLEEILEVVKSI